MNNLILILFIFIIGLIFFCNNSRLKYIEKFNNINNNNQNCPNILMKKNNQIYLYNNNLAHIPGINPIIFKTLEDYAQFVEWQQSQNIDCPILFLDTTYDTQNNEVYKITSNPFSQSEILLEPELIIPNTNTITPLYNANRSPSLYPYNQDKKIPDDFDSNDQYIGLTTPLDKMFHSNNKVSPNPMDSNWGGNEYTKSLVDSGYYSEDEVYGPGGTYPG